MTNGVSLADAEKAATSFQSVGLPDIWVVAPILSIVAVAMWMLFYFRYAQSAWEDIRLGIRRWKRRRFYVNHREFFQNHPNGFCVDAQILPGRKERILKALDSWGKNGGDPGDSRIEHLLTRILTIPTGLDDNLDPISVVKDLSRYHQFRCDVSLKMGTVCTCTDGPTVWLKTFPLAEPDGYEDFLVRTYKYITGKKANALRSEYLRMRILGSLVTHDPQVKKAQALAWRIGMAHAPMFSPALTRVDLIGFLHFIPPPPPPRGGSGQSNLRPPPWPQARRMSLGGKSPSP